MGVAAGAMRPAVPGPGWSGRLTWRARRRLRRDSSIPARGAGPRAGAMCVAAAAAGDPGGDGDEVAADGRAAGLGGVKACIRSVATPAQGSAAMSEHVTYRPSWAGSRAVERLGGRAAQDRQQGIVFGTQQARGALRVADHCGVSWSRHRHQAHDGRDLGLPSRLPVPACVEGRLDVRTCPSRFTAPLAFSGGLGIGSSISADHGYRHQRLRGAPARPARSGRRRSR